MKSMKQKRIYKQEYDYLWISKRLILLLENDLLIIGDPILKVMHCDEDYISESLSEAEEIVQSLTDSLLMNFIKKLPTVPKDHISFVDYACHAIEKIIIHRLKLDSNECISHFKIEYEKNMPNKIQKRKW